LVFKTRHFSDSTSKMYWPWNPGQTHSRSLKVVPFDRLGMVSYLCSIETLSLRRTVFEILDFKHAVTLKTGLGIPQGRWKCHHSNRVHTTSYWRSTVTMGLYFVSFLSYSSYLSGRTQHVRLTSTTSTPSGIVSGVPRGRSSDRSFSFCTLPTCRPSSDVTSSLHARSRMIPTTQIYGLCRPGSTDDLSRRV